MSWLRRVVSFMSMREASLGSEMAVYSFSSCLREGRCCCSCTMLWKHRSCSLYASCAHAPCAQVWRVEGSEQGAHSSYCLYASKRASAARTCHVENHNLRLGVPGQAIDQTDVTQIRHTKHVGLVLIQ